MMKNQGGKRVEYILYAMLFAALVMCFYFIIVSSSLSQQILAFSLAITIIVGGVINVWKIFHSSDKLDDVSNNLDGISNELTTLSNKVDDLVNLKEKEIAQTRDLEEHRRKDKERPATEPLKEEFEKFLLYWKENKELIFEKSNKKLIGGDILFKRKIPWMEIESIGKESKNVIEDNKNVLWESIEHEAIEIADAIIELSKLIRQIENLRLSDEYYIERKKRAFDEGDKIVKRIGAFKKKHA
ncbi:MAG: hypothetical protein KAT65_06015 [Methanophagales archaeon]|nr:hypothetical protein [Methanophagales archaeon]